MTERFIKIVSNDISMANKKQQYINKMLKNIKSDREYYTLYGKAIIISSKLLKMLFVMACFITIGTNWLIPIFVNKIQDIKIRY